MGTTSLSVLDQRLSEAISDWIEEDTTTNITTNTSVVSTALNKWDNARDDRFNGWWIYLTEGNNINTERLVYDYATSTGTLSCRGASFSAESGAITFRLYKYPYTHKVKAINKAIRDLSSVLFKNIDDRTLASGNNLPDGSFEDWTSSSALRFYAATNATLAQTTTAGYYRGPPNTTSVKVTASAANGYLSINSSTYPKLLDMMDRNVCAYVWVYPEVDDDATIVIYTLQSDGTAQTLTSTTACVAGAWNLLTLEDQIINDDLVYFEIRFKVATNAKYAYFDSARLFGRDIYEYVLPDSLQDGDISQVYVQATGYADYLGDEIHPIIWDRVWGSEIISDGTYRYLRLPYIYSSGARIRLVGTSPLTELSSFSGTTEISGELTDLLIAYAAYQLFLIEDGIPSGEDKTRFQSRADQWLMEYYRLLPSLKMMKPSGTVNLPIP
jgi:hypothetical protein